MLSTEIKKNLLIKIENLITEKKESEDLKKEFLSWFNNDETFIKYMNDSEKYIFKNYPDLIIKKDIYLNLHPSFFSYNFKSPFKEFFKSENIKQFDDDFTSGFYTFQLRTYPALFDVTYNMEPTNNSNKELSSLVINKLKNILKIRNKFLDKKLFIKRVLDSRDLTLTILKNNYKDLYNLYLS